jgi:hypothetical protein
MPPDLFLTNPVNRIHQSPTVWTIGCSVAHGIGLDQPELQSFGKLVADNFNMPYQPITRPGTSAHWSLTHLMHAELAPDDLVIWSVTYPERFRWAKDYTQIEERGVNWSWPAAVNWFQDPQIYFYHLDIINTGVRYLTAIGCKFVFTTFIEPSPYKLLLEENLKNYKQWCPIGSWNDYDQGNDCQHPGPIGHQEFAKSICDHVQLLEYDKSI